MKIHTHKAIVARLLAAGAAADPVDTRGRTPLHDTCDVIDLLEERSACQKTNLAASAGGGGGVDAAAAATMSERVNLARLLINAGADPGTRIALPASSTSSGGIKADSGMVPLHLACRSGRAELAAYLIRAGGSVSLVFHFIQSMAVRFFNFIELRLCKHRSVYMSFNARRNQTFYGLF